MSLSCQTIMVYFFTTTSSTTEQPRQQPNNNTVTWEWNPPPHTNSKQGFSTWNTNTLKGTLYYLTITESLGSLKIQSVTLFMVKSIIIFSSGYVKEKKGWETLFYAQRKVQSKSSPKSLIWPRANYGPSLSEIRLNWVGLQNFIPFCQKILSKKFNIKMMITMCNTGYMFSVLFFCFKIPEKYFFS